MLLFQASQLHILGTPGLPVSTSDHLLILLTMLSFVSCLLNLCSLSSDRGTIHKVVESRDGEHSLAFNIMEIQPFRHEAAIQGISLDTERVRCPLLPGGLLGSADT